MEYISDEKICPFDEALKKLRIKHKLIPPRTPWHNGKVERSYRNDQRYFYDWETFKSVEELNQKLAKHLIWSNNKSMLTLKLRSTIKAFNKIIPYCYFIFLLKWFTSIYNAEPTLKKFSIIT